MTFLNASAPNRVLSFLLLLLPLASFAQPGADLHLQPLALTAANGTKIAAESGFLTVKENRANPESADIELRFVRLKSTAENPLPPLVYLEGGPGSSATWMTERAWALDRWTPLLGQRDVILLDQRGTGAAGRRLTYIHTFGPGPDALLSAEGMAAHFRTMAPLAEAAWTAAGIDRRGYTTLESAHDIDALRQALGADKLALLGFSYGTHLGQAYLKYFGEHVDRAILAGVEGLAETLKLPLRLDDHFRRLSALVAADSTVGQDVPDLVALYRRVAGRLAGEPVALTLRNPLNGSDLTLPVGKAGLDMILVRDLGDASDLPVIPRLLYTMEQGDYSVFQWFVQKRISGLYGMHAMAMTMDMASGASPARRALIAAQAARSLFGNALNPAYLDIADVFPAPDLGADFRAGFTTNVPVLLLSGTLDLNTPPYQAERLRWQLPNAIHLIVENAGHEQILTNPAIEKAVRDFLDSKDVSGVRASYPPLRFLPVRGEQTEHPAG